jgi:hypothetical protein
MRHLALALLLTATAVHAQPKAPGFLAEAPEAGRLDTRHLTAHVESPVTIGTDGRGVLTLVVTPKPKMHVYAADVEGYVPFTIRVEAMAGLTPGRPAYPPSETYVFPPTGEASRAYMKAFRVRLPLTLTPERRRRLEAGSSSSGALTIRYQACDDTVCYRPATGTLSFEMVR